MRYIDPMNHMPNRAIYICKECGKESDQIFCSIKCLRMYIDRTSISTGN